MTNFFANYKETSNNNWNVEFDPYGQFIFLIVFLVLQNIN